MIKSEYSARIAIVLLAGMLASCGSTGEGSDSRYANADAPPGVLIRDLDVYRLVGNEEYVKIPISDDISQSEAQKFFTASADNLYFDAALYYRNGSVYFKMLSSIKRDKEGQLLHAEPGAVESAVNKTSSLSFRLGFVNEVDGREVIMPITAIYVDPSNYTRMEGARNSKGKKDIMLEYVGVLPNVPPSIFKRINSFDVTWSESDQASPDAAAAAVADPAAYAAAEEAVEPAPMDYDPAYEDAAARDAY
ncbi:MAG: hypothetical protein O9293_08390 [Porphyrobacter sp.]|nr:hypothetical protein [Porphyrobacter sp.]